MTRYTVEIQANVTADTEDEARQQVWDILQNARVVESLGAELLDDCVRLNQ